MKNRVILSLTALLLVVASQAALYAAPPGDPNNVAPIANAGPDQTVYASYDGLATAILDGSDSNDPDGSIVSYQWTWTIDNQTYEANGVDPEITLPVGTHVITLVVTDNADQVSAPDEVVITVIPPLEVGLKFTPQTLNLRSKGKWVKAHIKLPDGFSGRDVNKLATAFVEPFGVPSHYVHASNGKSKNVTIAFDRSGFSRAMTGGNGETVEVIVVGELKSGQIFFGTDTITLLKKADKPPKKPKE
jgi:hypothetical protein